MSELDELQRQRAAINAQIKEIEYRERKMIREKAREEFAERLKQARRERKISQRKLAQSIGIAPPSMSQMKQARYEPSIALLIRICETLKVSADELLGLKEE